MRAVIVCNGEVKDYEYISSKIKKDDFIICADGGYRHLKKMNIKPNLLIGDMDSIDENDFDGEIITLPVRKDFTDSEVCIKYVLLKEYDEVILLGFMGTRMDHTLANLTLLKQFRDANIKCRIIDEHNEIFYAAEGENKIYGKKGDLVSIIPLFGNLLGITTSGLEYSLDNNDLMFGESKGVSNVMTSDCCTININTGFGLIIKSKD